MVSKILVSLLIAGGVMTAQTGAATAETTVVSTTVVSVRENPEFKLRLDQQAKEISQLQAARAALEKANKELSLKLEALSKTNEKLLAAVKLNDTGAKALEDKLGVLEKTLEELKAQLDLMNNSFLDSSKKIETGVLGLAALKTTEEAFKVKLEITQDDIKVKSDEITALKDTISMNKGNIDAVILDNLELKRQLKEINAGVNSKKDEGILGWEYWGVVASGIGVLALIIAAAKK